MPKRKGFFYVIGRVDEERLALKEFELALQRKVAERVERGFIKTYRPVMDDRPYRIFSHMKDYHQWCNHHLPSWLGYGKTSPRILKSKS